MEMNPTEVLFGYEVLEWRDDGTAIYVTVKDQITRRRNTVRNIS